MTSSFFIDQVLGSDQNPPQYQEEALGQSFLTLRGQCPPDFKAEAYGTRGALKCTRVRDPPRQTNPSTKDYPRPGGLAKPGQASAPGPRGTRRYRGGPNLGYDQHPQPIVQSRRLYEVSPNPKVQVDLEPPGYPSRTGRTSPRGPASGRTARCRRPPEELDLVRGGYLRSTLEFDGIGFGRTTEDETTYLRGPLPNPPPRYDVTQLIQKGPVWLAKAKALGIPGELTYERVV